MTAKAPLTIPDLIRLANTTDLAIQRSRRATMRQRTHCPKRLISTTGMHPMKEQIKGFFELDEYLEDQVIPVP